MEATVFLNWVAAFCLVAAFLVAVWTINHLIDNLLSSFREWRWKRKHWMAHPDPYRWWED